jgi:hypothetical protein
MLITEKRLRTIIRNVLRESAMSDNEKVSEEKNIIYVPKGNWNSIIQIIKKNYPEIESFKNLTASKLVTVYNNRHLKVGEGLDVSQLIKKLNDELEGMPAVYSHKELKSQENERAMNKIFDQDAIGLDKAVGHMIGKEEPTLFEKYIQIMDKLYANTHGNKNAKDKIKNRVNKIIEKYEDDQNNPDLYVLLDKAKTILKANVEVLDKAVTDSY